MKNVVIIGGSKGVGAATARLLSDRYIVTIIARSPPFNAPSACRFIHADATMDDALYDALIQFTADLHDTSIVFCVGSSNYSPIDGKPRSQVWGDILRQNILSLANLFSAIKRNQSPPKNLIVVGSKACFSPSSTRGNEMYTASKHGIPSLVHDFRTSCKDEGIIFPMTLICPGFVRTPSFSAEFFKWENEHFWDIYRSCPSLTADEVGNVICWLISRNAKSEIAVVSMEAIYNETSHIDEIRP